MDILQRFKRKMITADYNVSYRDLSFQNYLAINIVRL